MINIDPSAAPPGEDDVRKILVEIRDDGLEDTEEKFQALGNEIGVFGRTKAMEVIFNQIDSQLGHLGPIEMENALNKYLTLTTVDGDSPADLAKIEYRWRGKLILIVIARFEKEEDQEES